MRVYICIYIYTYIYIYTHTTLTDTCVCVCMCTWLTFSPRWLVLGKMKLFSGIKFFNLGVGLPEMYPKLCMCKLEHSFLRRAFFRFIITFLHNSHHTKNQINKSSLPSISNYLKKYYNKPHPLPIGRIKMGASPAIFHSLKESPFFCELILTRGFYGFSPPPQSEKSTNPIPHPCCEAGTP